MGANNNKNKNMPQAQGTNPGMSGGDPRGRTQNQSGYQQTRYENQQGPMISAFARQYGRGSEADWGNYQDIMNRYRGVASSLGAGGDGTSTRTSGPMGPFESYGGFQEMSRTGGVDPAALRARAANQVRSVYSGAERELGRQRSLQGGYSPNAAAARVKMAREQAGAASDATINSEAALTEMAQRGRLAGLEGMSQIERSRIDAENANVGRQLEALSGMGNIYGTTPGMSQAFGNQLLAGVGQGGDFGLGLYGRDISGQQLPGAYEDTMGKVSDIGNMAYPWLDMWGQRRKTGLPSGFAMNAEGGG